MALGLARQRLLLDEASHGIKLPRVLTAEATKFVLQSYHFGTCGFDLTKQPRWRWRWRCSVGGRSSRSVHDRLRQAPNSQLATGTGHCPQHLLVDH